MGWVVPQFKCLPDTCHLTTRLWPALPNHHSSSQKLKNRESPSVRSRCLVLSTAVVAVDTFVTHSSTLATERPLTYVGAIGPPTKTDFEMKQAPKGLLPSEDSNIAVAAAEAVALARAAAEMAKDAMQMMGSSLPIKAVDSDGFPSEIDILLLERMRLTEMETPDDLEPSCIPENIPEEKIITANSFTEQQSTVSVDSEFELVRVQHSNNIAVKSGRQTERRARRSRAAEKVDASIVSTKAGSSSRKKRAALQEVDYSDPLRYLRGTTSTSKLLTAAEELELSEGIQDLLKLEKLHEELTERYGNKPTFVQWASAAGTDQKTLRRRLNCGTLCKDKMIKSNIRLVISIAKNFQGAGMNLQDLVQEGCRGLVRGAEKFDASKGFKFSTYAHWWIKQAVRKSLSDQSRTIRLPFHMVDATYRVREARKQFYSENGQYPNNEEIVEVTGLSMKRLQAVLLTPKAPRSLDQKIGINQNLKPSEVIADPNAETAESLLLKHFMKQDLNKVLDTLNPREKQVVRWRFGLEDGRMKTLQEIGELMGVSRERIRQIESCAFRKLKNKKKTKSLRQYLIS